MDTFKLTHAYAFELVKAARSMPLELAERKPHIQAIRTSLQQKALKGRANQLVS